MALEPLAATVAAINTGASAGTVNLRLVGLEGVRLTAPAAVSNVGVKVMVLATVPVCNRICVPWSAKLACVPLAGMLNATVRRPVENCTAGSLPNVPEVVSVSTPLIATG